MHFPFFCAFVPRTTSQFWGKQFWWECFLNYTQTVLMCVQLCGLRWRTFSSPPWGLPLKTKSSTADREPFLHYQLTHTEVQGEGPHYTQDLHFDPSKNQGPWWGTSLGSCWGISRHWLSWWMQICHIPIDDSLWELGSEWMIPNYYLNGHS